MTADSCNITAPVGLLKVDRFELQNEVKRDVNLVGSMWYHHKLYFLLRLVVYSSMSVWLHAACFCITQMKSTAFPALPPSACHLNGTYLCVYIQTPATNISLCWFDIEKYLYLQIKINPLGHKEVFRLAVKQRINKMKLLKLDVQIRFRLLVQSIRPKTKGRMLAATDCDDLWYLKGHR